MPDDFIDGDAAVATDVRIRLEADDRPDCSAPRDRESSMMVPTRVFRQ